MSDNLVMAVRVQATERYDWSAVSGPAEDYKVLDPFAIIVEWLYAESPVVVVLR